MNPKHTNRHIASVLTFALGVIAAPAAMADQTIYPGSNCGFEAQDSFRSLFKANAGTSSISTQGVIVTCPVPINVPRHLQSVQGRSVTYRVAVHLRDSDRSTRINCVTQKVTTSGSSTTSTTRSSAPFFTNSTLVMPNLTFALPLREWAVVRCALRAGDMITGYTVTTNNF